MAETTLPGRPKLSLVKKVKAVLWKHFRSRPQMTDHNWRQAWSWADNCRNRAGLFNFTRRPTSWPEPCEIASQYILLTLHSMKESYELRLSRYAPDAMPEVVALRLANTTAMKAIDLRIEQ